MSKILATKLHDALCPMCNNRYPCGGRCNFLHNASEAEWCTNHANQYFLKLSEKATAIMTELNLDEEQFIEYAKIFPYRKSIPDEVYSSMVAHDFN